jgi:hypothetical protein
VRSQRSPCATFALDLGELAVRVYLTLELPAEAAAHLVGLLGGIFT